jgi:CHAT domain-containing protein/tetratricopeptide (TPR) repeat protein
VPRPGEHPDLGLIAAHAEGRLTGAEAARIDEHLAGCPTCHEVFAETLRFALDEQAEGALPRTSPTVIPFVRRPAFRMAAVLAVAAGVFLAFQQLWRARSERAQPSLVAELAQAMGTTRFVEPRLTGGFEHGRLVILRSGDRAQGLDAHTPSVIAAVARIRERAEGDTSPEALGALAVTYLVSGDIGKAVRALESATTQDTKNPRLQSDLAAAYLVQASRLDEPADIPKALEAAEKAIELEDAPAEAWFNRALALEQLHLVDSARKAWEDFLERDSTSAWADEARKHLAELPPAQQSTLEEDRARARAALAEGAAAVDRLADEAPAILSDYFLSELLPAWADAQLTGHPNAVVLRTQARQVGEALLRTTGDALPQDAALVLASPPSGPSRDPPRTQALGYRALQEGQRLYDLQQPSCSTFRESRRLLESGGSPYSAWARERIVVSCLYPTESREALGELSRIESIAKRRGHVRLLGRVQWMEALFHIQRGEFTASLDRYRLSRDGFRSLRDRENEARVQARLAQVFQTVGDNRSAWRERLRGLALLDSIRGPAARHGTLSEVALASLFEKLLRTALHVQSAAVEAARRWSSPTAVSDALVWRSGILHALGFDDRAVADLVEARRWIPLIGDGPTAEGLGAQADEAEGQILATREPERAAACLGRALAYFERAIPAWVPGVRLLLARAQAVRGLDAAAEEELEAGIRLMESQRASLQGAAQQASFFDQAASLFDEMVVLQADKHHDPLRALAFVERGRARQLVESLRSPPAIRAPRPSLPAATPSVPLDPEELQRELPDGLALVYYACLPNRLFSWVLTREGVQFFERPVPLEDLRHLVAVFETATERRAPLAVVREQGARLFDELVRPLLPALGSRGSLILIADGPLGSVPFASLWNRQTGRYLAEDYFVGLAPSGTVFARASAAAAAAARERAPHLLAVGNPRLDRDLVDGLPSLPGAEAEAAEVARLYERFDVLTGRAATKRAFLEGARRSQVVHFAGHAASGDTSGAAHLLFASDPDTKTPGALYPYEIDRRDFPRTRVVVLAGCRTAAGAASRLEGALGLARPFLAAGVPSVVASLWDVDDAVSRRFSVAFHRSLLAEGDPALALRRAQIALLRDADPSLAHPASWAGFVMLGGLDHSRLTVPARAGGSL